MSSSELLVLVDGSSTGLLSVQLSAPTPERSWRWINTGLIGYILKLLWSSDSLHHTQPVVLNLLVHRCYERQELAQQENTILACALCFLGLLLSFVAFLGFTGSECAIGAAAEVLSWEPFALMPLCLNGTGCILSVQQRRKVCLWQSQGHWTSYCCAEKAKRGICCFHPFPHFH